MVEVRILAQLFREVGKKLKEREKKVKKPEIITKVEEAKVEEAKKVEELVVRKPEVRREVGVKIPRITIPRITTAIKKVRPEEVDLTKINIYYQLIPRTGKPVYAYAVIRWDPAKHALTYRVVEPALTREDEKLLNKIKDTVRERLDVDLSRLRKEEAKKYLSKRIDEIIKFMQIGLTEQKRKAIKYYLERDFIGLEKIQPLLEDPNLEDISCVGVGVPIFVFHRDPKIGSLETNIVFSNHEDLDRFVMKLAQRAGKSISMASPLVDASLPDGSRLQATLGTDIARRGSNFTIRKFTELPLTPTDILNFGTADVAILAYLWLCVEHGKNVLVAGGTATGKTSLLNVLSLFIKPEMKVLTIEDTPELRLTHQYWMPEVAREPIAGEEFGKVDLYSLLRESLRQRPDYIIVGEVRGREAFVLFQQMTVGHPGLSTIHAENLEKLVDRLTTEPISLSPGLLENLDVIVFLTKVRRKGVFARRISQILEMERWSKEQEAPIVNEVFRWDPATDSFKVVGDSIILEEIAKEKGISEQKLRDEVLIRAKVLHWMQEQKVVDYREVGKILSLFYSTPERLFKQMEAS